MQHHAPGSSTRGWLLASAIYLLSQPAIGAIAPTGSVNQVGGDPADDGPVQPTAGDLIVPDTDFIILDGLSSLLIDGSSLLRAGGITSETVVASLTVSGAGTRVETLNDLNARIVIDGNFSILNGAVVDAGMSPAGCVFASCGVGIANSSGSNATMLVSGAGSTLISTEAFTVAQALNLGGPGNAVGSLRVEAGGVINADRIGFSQGNFVNGVISEAFVTITGAGSQINAASSAIIGNEFGSGAQASLLVEDQASFDAGGGLVAGLGVDTQVDIDVTSGGSITSERFATALGLGSTVAVRLDGAASTFTIADDFIVGQFGTGSLEVTNNAAITIGGGAPGGFLGSSLVIGTRVGAGSANPAVTGTGSLLLDNSTITILPNTDLVDAFFNIGLFGDGTAVVRNGASLLLEDVGAGLGSIGDGISVAQSQAILGATATLDIQGAGTSVTVNSSDVGFLTVGLDQAGSAAAVGTVNVESGASLNITGTGTRAASGIVLGRGTNAVGTLNVTGAGSSVNVLGAPGGIVVAGDIGNSVGNGSALFTASNGAVVNLNSTDPGQSSFTVGLGTGDGVLQVTDAQINIDGGLFVSIASATNNTQSGVVLIDSLGEINALDVFVGDRGQLSGDGELNTNTLNLSTGAVVDRQDLSRVQNSTTLDGGLLNLSDAVTLGAGQTLDASNAGVIDIGSPTFSLSNGGSVSLSGAGTRLSLLSSASDLATINGAVQLNNQARFELGGNFNLNTGSVLSGDGGTLVANLVNINSGGTLAPGNSPGTLNVVGDVVLNGGTISLEIGGGQAGDFDVLNVDGSLNLNTGSIEVELINGFSPGGRTFDVFTATGALTLDPGVALVSVGAGPDYAINISQSNGVNIGTVSFLSRNIATATQLTRAQQPVAGYIDSVCPKIEALALPNAIELDLDTVCGNLRNGSTSDGQVARALTAISPDDIIGAVDSLFRFTGIQHGNLARRLNGLRNGAERVNLRGINIQTEDVTISGEDLQNAIAGLASESFDRWGFFSEGRINFGDRDESVRVRGFDFDTISFTLGTDYRLSRNLYLGVALGYNEVDADFDAGGGLTQRSTTLSVLGTYFNESSFYLDAMLTYGISSLDTARSIIYTDSGGSVNRKASGDTDGDQIQMGVGTGFDFGTRRLVWGPHLGANYADITVDSFAETGAGGLNFAMPQQVTRSLTANAGVHASYTLTPRWGVLVPYLRADYVHEFKHDADRAKVRLVADRFGQDALDPTRALTVETDGSDANYLVWSVGMHAQFIHGIAAFLDYRGTSGLNDLDISEVTVGMRFEHQF